MNADYMTIPQYIECKSKVLGKIAVYDLLIDGLEKSILEATLSGQYAEYEMDDGQMKVRSRFRSIDQMTAGMQGLRKIRQDYINQYNGRTVRLVGGSL